MITTIRAVMHRDPLSIAVTDGDVEWSYDTLRQQADFITAGLQQHGVCRGSVVGMHLPRSADAIAAMLGIMAAGCVYLPLDPAYPGARLRFMLERADAAAVVSRSNDRGLYGARRVWIRSATDSACMGTPEDAPSPSVPDFPYLAPDESAYILFTSGSTGEPKGVEVSHGNITLMTRWSAQILDLTCRDSSATATSLNFDACFHEILVPLSVGGTVHIISHALALGQLDRPVSFVACTPTLARELIRADLLPPLKVLMVGGEALGPDVAAQILKSGRVGRLLNCYGPTECTVCATVQEVTEPVPATIPIGRQVPGTDVFILDERGDPVPDGGVGEICIAGGQVAAGYVNDPVGTAERFVVRDNPDAGVMRYYRTGDLGYRLARVLYFAGRADRQVKINGCRVELAEADAALRSHSDVADATTVVSHSERLVAYVVPVGADVDIPDLRRHLARTLPPFMLPAGIVLLREIPKTVSGKLDEAKLPLWTPSRPAEAPLAIDGYTEWVVRAVTDVTGFAGQIRPTDDFIDDLGGTSLGIIRVLSQLERYSGNRLCVSDALADTSVAGLARLVRGDVLSSQADFAFNTHGQAPPLFLIHVYLGGMLKLRRLAELLPPHQPVYGIHVHCTEDGQSGVQSFSVLAKRAWERIRSIQPNGRITMAGHSAGGLIALEVGRKALEAGEPGPSLLLIDSVRPSGSVGYLWGEILLNLSDLKDPSSGERIGPFRAAWSLLRERLNSADNDDLTERTEKNELSTNSLIRHYRAKSYRGPLTVMRTRQGRLMAFGRADLGWGPRTEGKLRLIDIPGTHVGALEHPHLLSLADEIGEWLSSNRA